MSRHLDSAVFHRDLSREPLLITHGEGAFLFDERGQRYLDAAAGAAVASLGHGNRELADVLATQARRLSYAHPSKFATGEALELAEKMVARSPEGLTRVLFTSGGSESTEAAIKLARQVQLAWGRPGKHKIVTRRNSYHGATLGALAVSGLNARRLPFRPMMMAQPMIAPTSCYRCPFDREPRSCALECAGDLETVLLSEGPDSVAAFIAEPIVGAAAPGRHPPDGYWRRIRETCDRYRILFIADEVMSGNGRSGKWWAIQHAGVCPDIITTAKGIGAGYTPLGAVLLREELFQAMFRTEGHFRHGHTYGGNPLSCAVGSRVIDIIEREGLLDNVRHVGELLLSRLETVLGDHPQVGTIRGRGLLAGVEFVADRTSKQPFDPALGMSTRFSHACLERGLYLYQGGGHLDRSRGDHVLLAPPFIIGEGHVEMIVEVMAEALEAVVAEVVA